jgi:hypothetical protein
VGSVPLSRWAEARKVRLGISGKIIYVFLQWDNLAATGDDERVCHSTLHEVIIIVF